MNEHSGRLVGRAAERVPSSNRLTSQFLSSSDIRDPLTEIKFDKDESLEEAIIIVKFLTEEVGSDFEVKELIRSKIDELEKIKPNRNVNLRKKKKLKPVPKLVAKKSKLKECLIHITSGNMTISECSRVFKISKSIIYNGLKKFNVGANPFIDLRGKKPIFNNTHGRFLKELLEKEENLLLSAGKVKDILLTKFKDIPKKISLTTIRIHLKEWGFNYKSIKIRNETVDTLRIKKLKEEFCRKFARSLKMKELIIFTDESNFQSKKIKAKSWSLKGVYQIKKFPKKTISLSCFLAISQKGIIGIKFTSGTNTQVEYSHFLRSLRKTLGSQRTTLVVDNASIHKGKLSKTISKSLFFEVLTPPYSPEFNPCEQVFRHLKYFLSSKYISTRDELTSTILSCIRMINASEIQKYYLESLREMNIVLMGLD